MADFVQCKGEDHLKELMGNGKSTIAYFTADWCGPCQALKSKIKEDNLLTTYPDCQIVLVDVDEHGELAEKMEVEAMPTLKLFDKEGKKCGDDLVGPKYDEVKAKAQSMSSK